MDVTRVLEADSTEAHEMGGDIRHTWGAFQITHSHLQGGWDSMLSVSLTSSKLLLPVPSNERCGVLGVFVCLCCGAFDWVLAAVCELSLVAASGGYSLVAVLGLLFAVASLVVDHTL